MVMAQSPARIALVGDFDPGVTAHRAIEQCFARHQATGRSNLQPVWLGTESIVVGNNETLKPFSGFWCVPATPYRNTAGALWAIRFAREQGVPFLGTCGGFQHALLEFARHVLGLADAEHAETNPGAAVPLLTQ